MTGVSSSRRSYSTFAPTAMLKENRHKATKTHTSFSPARALPSRTEARVAQPADALTKGEQAFTILLSLLALTETATLITLWLVFDNIITINPRTFSTNHPRLTRLGSYREITFVTWITTNTN